MDSDGQIQEEAAPPQVAAGTAPASPPTAPAPAEPTAAAANSKPPTKRQRIPIPIPIPSPPASAQQVAAPAPAPAEPQQPQPQPQPPPKPNTAFLSHYLTGLGRGNERRAACDASRAGLAATGQSAQAAARPMLQLAAPKGEAALRQAAVQAALQARQAACVGTLIEVARVFGFHLSVAADALEGETAAGAEAEAEAPAGDRGTQGGREPALPGCAEQRQGGEAPLPLAPLAVRLRLSQAGDEENGRQGQEDASASTASKEEVILAMQPGTAAGGRLVSAALAHLGASPARPSSRQGVQPAAAASPLPAPPAAAPGAVHAAAAEEEEAAGQLPAAAAAAVPAAAPAGDSYQAQAEAAAGGGVEAQAEVEPASEGRARKRRQLVGGTALGGALFGAALAGLAGSSGGGRPGKDA